MKRLLLGLASFAALAVFSTPAEAQWGPGGYYQHHRYHDDLQHRDFHRDLYHRDAHHYPMTWRQHGRLHDALEHDAYHDRLEHREYHRQQYRPHGSYYPGSGFGYSGRGFSIWFGQPH